MRITEAYENLPSVSFFRLNYEEAFSFIRQYDKNEYLLFPMKEEIDGEEVVVCTVFMRTENTSGIPTAQRLTKERIDEGNYVALANTPGDLRSSGTLGQRGPAPKKENQIRVPVFNVDHNKTTLKMERTAYRHTLDQLGTPPMTSYEQVQEFAEAWTDTYIRELAMQGGALITPRLSSITITCNLTCIRASCIQDKRQLLLAADMALAAIPRNKTQKPGDEAHRMLVQGA
jgi:hypothetical protein